MLSVHLANIKSSGVYRFIFDKSEATSQTPQTMRLVVGYSEKGPFNTVTYVKNESVFKEIYGNGSKKLEKYGCFFHRLALQCLSKEPILCLNLKEFQPKDDDHTSPNVSGGYEAVYGVSMNPFSDEDVIASVPVEVEKIFDSSRLWTLSPEVLPDDFTSSKFISFALTDTKKNSDTVFIRPSLATGYDVTLRDWYNNYCNGEYPDYMEDSLDTLVSDYLVDVYIFRGKFTSEVAFSDTFAEYFTKDASGNPVVRDYIVNAYDEKKDALEALSQVEGSGFLVRYTGSLIPYFKNTDGSWMSIDLVVNNGTDTHNVMMYLNEDMLEDGSLDPGAICLGGYGYNDEDFDVIGSFNRKYGTDNTAVYMYNIWEQDINSKEWKLSDDSKNDFTYGDPAIDIFPSITPNDSETSKSWYEYSTDDSSILYVDPSMPVGVGDHFFAANGTGKKLATILRIDDYTRDDGRKCNQITLDCSPVIKVEGIESIVRYNHKLTAHAGSSLPEAAIKPVAAQDAVYYTQEEIDAAVEGDDAYGKTTSDIKTPAVEEVEGKAAVEFSNDAHVGIYLEGYTYLDGKPKGSSWQDKYTWINKQLDVLKNKGLREALTNSTDTDYRYIVDTFEAFPENGLRSKLASVAKEKKNAFVISNFPAMKTFAKDANSSWSDKNGLNTKYIAAGYNKSQSTNSRISMPSESNGASYIAFYTPLKFDDNGLKINVPSAGLVSNNFMDKYTSRQPYYVVAGPSYGRMDYDDMIGPDYNFTRDDLDNLEPMGVNCMVYKPQRGTFINSNQTAKQKPVTGLSKVNIVELVIYLQDQIADMLQGYQWELNTQTLRDNIKTKADIICEAVKANGGLYDYNNICDDTNNTDEVIDNEMVVLSTAIEPAKGAGKMVHELTIYRKGGMSSIIK